MNSPNILLITTDQQRWDAVGANDNPSILTPNLDRLAAEGVRFVHSYCAAAACQPSRACILTGVYPTIHGVMQSGAGRWVPSSLPTLPGLLSAHGYRTVGIGKMHFVPWDALCGFQRRVIIEGKYAEEPDEYQAHIRDHDLQGRVIGHQTPGFGKANKAMVSPLNPEDHIDGFVGQRSIEMLETLIAERRLASRPFFAWVSFCGPHDPYDPPEPYASMYDPVKVPPPRRADGELDRVPPIVREETTAFGIEKLNLWGIPDAEIRRIRALYYGNVTLIDEWVGRVLKLLERQEVAENTLVIFTSDHGDYLGDHDLLWKAYLPCDADMKVPLLIRWPGQVPSGTCAEFSTNVDLMPTILSAAGAPVPRHCQGFNLLDPIKGARPPRREAFMFAEPNKWRYRDVRWAYTRWPEQRFDTLYDLAADPHELNNLCFGVKEPPLQARLLRDKLETWLRSTYGHAR
ncbi:MAG: sulfatase-like hydrolase/transferase [Verrucomicrobia bacterium]|nr:sulfatase-like hydrolase/transferase [Verrucomicrobiota bacterium]